MCVCLRNSCDDVAKQAGATCLERSGAFGKIAPNTFEEKQCLLELCETGRSRRNGVAEFVADEM